MLMLTNADRCGSRCGAQAYAWAKVNGSVLYFCGHHWRVSADKVVPLADTWMDERPPEMRW